MKIEKQNPGFAKRVKSWLTGKYVENGATASQNIPAGKWVTWKGQVCYSKTAITAGDTLSSSNLGTDDEGMANHYDVLFDNTITSSNVEYTVPNMTRYKFLVVSIYFQGDAIRGDAVLMLDVMKRTGLNEQLWFPVSSSSYQRVYITYVSDTILKMRTDYTDPAKLLIYGIK